MAELDLDMRSDYQSLSASEHDVIALPLLTTSTGAKSEATVTSSTVNLVRET